VILLVYAHPHHSRSRANRVLLEAAATVPGVKVHDLYSRYPDFDVDARAERPLLEGADTLVLQHPIYWYSLSALAKLWLDEVFTSGWAYGPGGRALAGKRFFWAVTTGGSERDYAPGGAHERAFTTFVAPMEQTARFCGMEWLPPFVLHDAHVCDDAALAGAAAAYRDRIAALARDGAR